MRIPLLLVISLIGINSFAQNTTRKKLKLNPKALAVETNAGSDTIYYPPTDSISLYGYEKAQTSTKETFFVSNHSSNDISKIRIILTYSDLHGSLLHRHDVDVNLNLSAGETRFVSIKSWDPNKLWFYTGTQARHNAYSNPFDVSYKIVYVIKNNDTD